MFILLEPILKIPDNGQPLINNFGPLDDVLFWLLFVIYILIHNLGSYI